MFTLDLRTRMEPNRTEPNSSSEGSFPTLVTATGATAAAVVVDGLC